MLTSLTESSVSNGGSKFSVDADATSPVLIGLVDGVRLLSDGQTRPPTLILAGDVLDLALSPDEVAATVFGGFAREALSGEHPVFDPIVYYLPGNHDHHLWETTRENQYVDYVDALAPDQPLVTPWHTTWLEPAAVFPETRSALLTGLARRQPGCEGVEVRVSYPNLALRAAEGDRCIVVSHGHFTEPMYTLMSQLKDILYPEQRFARFDDIDRWEEENFAWIDFLWSTLGRSGEVGSDVGLIYADLTSPSDLDVLASRLSTALLARGNGPKALRPVEHWVLNAIFRREVSHVIRSERGTPTVALTPKGRQGLLSYLEGPLLVQMMREWGRVPDDVTFVYGHTHKPYLDRCSVSGFPQPVAIVNTGGWVVDTVMPAPVQAGVALLVNDELESAALELYRQTVGTGGTPVRLLTAPPGEEASAWHDELADRIDPLAAPWASLSIAAAQLASQRHRLETSIVKQGGGPPLLHPPSAPNERRDGQKGSSR
jgi:hypothetical protein